MLKRQKKHDFSFEAVPLKAIFLLKVYALSDFQASKKEIVEKFSMVEILPQIKNVEEIRKIVYKKLFEESYNQIRKASLHSRIALTYFEQPTKKADFLGSFVFKQSNELYEKIPPQCLENKEIWAISSKVEKWIEDHFQQIDLLEKKI